MVLADLGADVIKVERPGERRRHPRRGGRRSSATTPPTSSSLNRNKRSIALDLPDRRRAPASSDGSRADADVRRRELPPGTDGAVRARATTRSARRERPAPGHVLADGVRRAAPRTPSRPGYDIIVQALSGLMSVTGERDGEPTKVGVALLDVITGLYAANGDPGGAARARATGRGRHVSVVALRRERRGAGEPGRELPARRRGAGADGDASTRTSCRTRSFHASDRPFILAAGNDRLFAAHVRGRSAAPDLARRRAVRDERGSRGAPRRADPARSTTAFAERTAAAWLDDARTGGGAVRADPTIDEVFASPEGAAPIQTGRRPRAAGRCGSSPSPIRLDGVRRPSAARRRGSASTRGDPSSDLAGAGAGSMTAARPLARALRGLGASPTPSSRPRPSRRGGSRPELLPPERRGRRRIRRADADDAGGRSRRCPTGGRSVIDIGVRRRRDVPAAGGPRRVHRRGSTRSPTCSRRSWRTPRRPAWRRAACTGTWPEVARRGRAGRRRGRGHVLYNVADDRAVRPRAHAHARQRVVLELTANAPARLDARSLAPVPRSRAAVRADGRRRAGRPRRARAFAGGRDERVGGRAARQRRLRAARGRGRIRSAGACACRRDRDAEVADGARRPAPGARRRCGSAGPPRERRRHALVGRPDRS